jgi:GNAT superfamily N-acetyltransferase
MDLPIDTQISLYLKQLVAHWVVQWGTQITESSEVLMLRNKNHLNDHVLIIAQEQQAVEFVAAIAETKTRHVTGYFFSQAESELQEIESAFRGKQAFMHNRLFLMRKSLEVQPELPDVPVQLAQTKDDMLFVAKSARKHQSAYLAYPLPPMKLGMKLYYCIDNNQAIGWARNAQGVDGSSWVTDVFTMPQARKKGIATAIMRQIHLENFLSGNIEVFLIAHEERTDFYHRLGYETVVKGVLVKTKTQFWQRVFSLVKRWLKVSK